MNKRKIFYIMIAFALFIIIGSLFVKQYPWLEYLMYVSVVLILLFINRYASVITELDEDNSKLKFFKRFNLFMIIVFGLVLIGLYYFNHYELGIMNKDQLIISLCALAIIIVGNYLPKLPRNHYVGIRLPWTVSDSRTWNYTNRLFGKLAFPIGLLIMIINIFYINYYILIIGMSILLIISTVSSFIYYKKEGNNNA